MLDADAETEADVIYVLGGDNALRVPVAARLFRQHVAPRDPGPGERCSPAMEERLFLEPVPERTFREGRSRLRKKSIRFKRLRQ